MSLWFRTRDNDGSVHHVSMPFSLLAFIVFVGISVAFLLPFVRQGFSSLREARVTAVRSYVLSVCDAVEHYRAENGFYPQSLNEIDTSTLDSDRLGIPLDQLDYVNRNGSFALSYTLRPGQVIECP